ncbi:MAG: acyl CoA:acetate/3-ketoacid CoA transferase [Burkholderiales bacterium RIFCSPLOWO2_12_67_14]|nr:MAG: acyl CoA:acetate/3-ketoacid CoA transferase [Burkholderiales bacterium RIFCSPLOWO2_02_FULL_67_64]OGB39314.1 MAG: acyl CoA:acetate/3-ketoacid CoA transferase [Burkholderiales bacterium RIFCSPHIGHO2_12_FULL_67_38]OGB44147.1 MAG: acyl CoA:acetate/3-ketoacid CoA transferase [Burkholderiales bacterium RIFCSPLOWO2_12_67_14]OGB76188.1 MAG: acyl CoA:acetate/3-ketoacid CoA transferase [Burkholderiales bacterium RIFCSPLOWO2_12_FULL_67_210]
MKVITADEAGALIADDATIFLGGLAVTSLPEEVLQGVERTFLNTGHPRNLTTWACGAVGNSGEAGMKHFAHAGMIKRVIAGHFGQTGKEMMKMVFDGEVEAYNFPQGSLSHLTRQIANRSPGLLTQVGLGTFVDPRLEGGKMNSRSTEDLVKLVTFEGQEWLYYAPPKIDVAIIRGTLADERGNITLDKEGMLLEQLSIAQAAKRWGGIVICQVEAVVKAGSLHPKAVKVPGLLVDYVVIGKPENHMQSIATQFNPALCGDIKVPTGSMVPMPLDERKVIARRAAMEVTPGAITNLGIGIPAGIPTVAAEEGVSDLLTLSIESGVNGGIPAQLGDFGLAYNAESIIEQSSQFDFYDGGGLDASFLGLAQTDVHGNVNVSKFNGRPVGCGGFVNITRSTKKLVFCGSFTAGGLDVRVGDGKLTIVKDGKARKFIEQVEQITFNGHDAALRQQQVVFITERAVFRLCEEGLELTEIAPGVDLERDVLAHMAFKPIIKDLKTMDPGIFSERWGGLHRLFADHAH